MSGTHIKLGSHRIALLAGSSIADAAGLLGEVTRINLRALRDDPSLREEAIRRVFSKPCASRCYVSRDGADHDCDCASGFQWTTDPEAQALEGCPPRDVWNDLRSLIHGHKARGAGPDEPIACDCDCLTPATLAVAAYTSWLAPKNAAIGGVNLGAYASSPSRPTRFAVGITLPPPDPSKERIGHAYGLINAVPAAPQPMIRMPFAGGPWYVWDASAHHGMTRPPNDFYTLGKFVAFEVRRDDLDGLGLTK